MGAKGPPSNTTYVAHLRRMGDASDAARTPSTLAPNFCDAAKLQQITALIVAAWLGFLNRTAHEGARGHGWRFGEVG